MLDNLRPKSRGKTELPLLEAALLFAALWLASYLPSGPAVFSLGEPLYHLGLLGTCLARALFLLYFMASAEGLGAFGIGPARPRDLPWALLAAAGAACLALVPSALAALLSSLGAVTPSLSNPLLDAVARPAASPALVLPLVLLSSLAVGYSEELFFRVYLIQRLEDGGLPLFWACAASSLLFGGAHGAQGLLGIVLGAALGAWFAWLWSRRRSLHEIALGHALYDAAVMFLALYSR
jgi:membrane protease YdiL (CAAX protease family)